MGMIKYPYELSVWKEQLSSTTKKTESKGVIIGAHDMGYLGKATNITLTRKLNGTNTLTFSMPDRYFDSLKGEFVRNEFIDVLSPESKIKLHYKDRWYEFFIKKTDEKKVFKSYIKTFTCTDAFIDELSRNGYGITFDTELNNNVREIGDFTEEVLEDSIWIYAPQYNWGDFTEYKEEKLFKIPVSQFTNLSAYKLNFNLSDKQLDAFDDKEITNITTLDKRPIVLSDDIARGCFWDQRDDESGTPDNKLKKKLITDVPNDGYIYVPYSCLNFCYGSDPPIDGETIAYDRAATETALVYPNTEKLAIAPYSVNPNTLIQFYAFPLDYAVELDEAGVIISTDHCYFMTLRQWNENVQSNNWYFFEDVRLVKGEILGSADLKDVNIRHTYRYIKEDSNVLNTPKEALGNKCVVYDGYLSDINNVSIIKGKKFSITDRTEVNISEDIDQYVTVYNNHADNFINEYTSDTWQYSEDETVPYKVCSKIETRQVIPQLARNLVQNGVKMNSEDGWSPMTYEDVLEKKISTPTVKLRTIKYPNENQQEDEIIDDTAIMYTPSRGTVGYEITFSRGTRSKGSLSFDFKDASTGTTVHYQYYSFTISSQPGIKDIGDFLTYVDSLPQGSLITLYLKNNGYYQKQVLDTGEVKYVQLFTQGDPIYVAFIEIKDGKYFMEEVQSDTKIVKYEYVNPSNERIDYYVYNYVWSSVGLQFVNTVPQNRRIEHIDYYFDDNNYSIINFGIVGQNKTIEKDKVYCLGISSFIEDQFDTDPFSTWFDYPKRIKNAQGDVAQTKMLQSIRWNSVVLYPDGTANEVIENSQYLSDLRYVSGYDDSWISYIRKAIQEYNSYIRLYGTSQFEAFEIKIGEGKLVSDGQYYINAKKTIGFNSSYFYKQGVYPEQIDFSGFDTLTSDISIAAPPQGRFIFFKSDITIDSPYIIVKSRKRMLIFELYLFECYTKGIDSFSDEGLRYRYSGRDMFWPIEKSFDDGLKSYSISMTKEEAKKIVIFEDDIMLGSTYEYQHYFIQRLKAKKITKDETTGKNNITYTYYDTTGKDTFIDTDNLVAGELPLDESEYSLDDCEVETNFIDLNRCPYYNKDARINDCDCSYDNGQHLCYYQRFGYCPYRFETEKHDRRIRTLSVSKSNRFNIIQEESKVFEVYPQFYIQHNENGTVKKDNEDYLKQVYFITERGNENKIGFRYEKNLKDISRSINSENIVTKLYVLDVDSELSKTGLCSIKTAEDNPSADSYIIDLSYYIAKGMLDEDVVEQDLYGIYPLQNSELIKDVIPSGFLRQLGYYNKRYDELTNNIINLQDASYNELEANLTVNLEGIVTAQEQILKAKKQLSAYTQIYIERGTDPEQYKDQATYKNYVAKLHEQQATLSQLIYDTFYTDGKPDLSYSSYFSNEDEVYDGLDKQRLEDYGANWRKLVDTSIPLNFFNIILDFEKIQETWVKEHIYNAGILGQFNREYLQLQQWKKERASYLKLINQISAAFYKKYEPYLKEGTWSDNNYLTDNAYYFGALDVAAEGAIPKVTYNVSVLDISQQNENYEFAYSFDLADVTYVEDIGMFGINKKTGLPNKLKVLISEVTEDVDDQSKNNIKVQNFTTQFEDLFQQVTATVQSLTFNENIYKRSSNFNSLQNISNSSLQGALDTNDLTLLNTDENNIKMDNNGTSGSDINNHANQYKLNGQGLFFSNDGGQHWSVGVGPKGINADYIKVGNLDAGKIKIADSSYIYFSWDKNGIVAYRNPQGVNTDSSNVSDMAVFNRYGLSVVQNGRIKLRAGYSYNGEERDFSTEQEQGGNIGFYLYNNDGYPIFSAASDEATNGAQIQLKGEMIVSDALLIDSGGSTEDTWYYKKEYEKTIVESYSIPTIEFHGSVGDIVSLADYSLTDTLYNKYGVKYPYLYPLSSVQVYEANDPQTSPQKITVAQFRGNNGSYYYCRLNDVESTTQVYLYYDNAQSNPPVPQGNRYAYTIGASGYCMEKMKTNNYSVNYVEIDSITGYKDPDGNMWLKEEHISGSGGATGAVALYLNNLENSNFNSDNSTSSRMLVCAKGQNGHVNNILTILKGGQLYIGGIIQSTTGANLNNISDLPSQVKVVGAGIRVEGDGKLHIDFNNIVNDSQSISNYIDESVESRTPWNHRHSFNIGTINADFWALNPADRPQTIEDFVNRYAILGILNGPDYYYTSLAYDTNGAWE